MTGNRADQLIQDLELQPHPEGGFFREVYRSGNESDGRSVVTTIYFLLKAGQISRLHQVDADEIWHWYEGSPLLLQCITPALDHHETFELGPAGSAQRPVHIIPAHHWQAAETTGDYTLVGCSVAPGFEFSGFRFMDQASDRQTVSDRFRAAERYL